MKIFTLCFALLACVLIGCSDEKLNQDSTQSSVASIATPNSTMAIPMTAEAITKGKSIYATSCSACHGSSGKGDGPAAASLNPKPRDHTNGAYMDKLTNDHIFKVIRYGGSMFGYPTMPAQPNLSDDEIKEVVAYVRTLSNTYKRQ